MVRKSRNSNKENCSVQATEKTIPLNSTDDTDIIECSIDNEDDYNFLKKGKCSFKKPSEVQSPVTPLEIKDFRSNSGSLRNSNKALRLSLRKSFDLSDDEAPSEKADIHLQTPHLSKNSKEANSLVKKMISALKKTPDGPYLTKSRLQNIEKWLNENEVEVVRTPPFANLSVTPIKSLKKMVQLPSQVKEKNQIDNDSSLDSDVEGVLKAVYGEDWQQKNIQSRAKTEPKKKTKRFLMPVFQTTEKEPGGFQSVRRNILKGKKLILDDRSDVSESNLDDSVVSGVRMINLNSSDYSSEPPKASSIKKRVRKKKSYVESSDESLYVSPAEKKKVTPLNKIENKKQTPVASSKKEVAFKTPKKTFLASLSVSTPTSKCHPDAQYYKVNFKSKKEELVKKLYKLYNSEVFEGKLAEDMNFSWNVKLRGTAGYCYNKRVTKSTGEVIRLSRVEFSTKIVDRADRLRDTMIHELCHAASWVIDGVLDGHGAVWSTWASRAMRRFPELPLIKRCHNYEIVSKYVYRCTGCGYSIKRHSKSINTERKRCGHCYGVLELLVNKKRKGKGEVPEFDTTRTLPTPNKFALFVKENYHSVKSTKTNAKHSEIMKILSQEYALLKNGTRSAKNLTVNCPISVTSIES